MGHSRRQHGGHLLMARRPATALLLVLLFRTPCLCAATDDGAAIAHRFASALETADALAFRPIAGSSAVLSSEAWRDVVDLVETVQPASVRVESVGRVTNGQRWEIRVELEAWGFARSDDRRLVRLPRVWWLTPCASPDGGAICAARTDASRTLQTMLVADDPERQRSIDLMAPAAIADVARALRRRRTRLDETSAARDVAAGLKRRAASRPDADGWAEAQLALAHTARLAGSWKEGRALAEVLLSRLPQPSSRNLAAAALEAAGTAGPDDASLFDSYITRAEECVDSAPELEIETLERAAVYKIDTLQLADAFAVVSRLRERAAKHEWSAALADAGRLEGFIYRVVHNDRAASAAFAESARLAEVAGRQDLQATALLWLARSELRNDAGDARVLEMLRRARSLMPADAIDPLLDLLGSIAIMESKTGDLAAARRTAAEIRPLLAIVANEDSRRNGWYGVAAVRRAEHRYAEAAVAASESLRAGERWSLWGAYYTKMLLADDLRKLGRNGEALSNLKESVELIEARRALVPLSAIDSVHYFTDKASNYWTLADLLVETGAVRDALLTIERARSGTLLDLQSNLRPAQTASGERRRMEAEIVALNRRVMAARTGRERKTARDALRRRRGDLERLQTQLVLRQRDPAVRPVATPRLLDVGSRIPGPNMAVVQYAVGENRTLMFVVTAGAQKRPHVTARRIRVSRKELGAAVRTLSTKIRSRDFDYHRDARRLYRLLLAPAAELIESRHSLCIVPDDVLWQLPFQALEGSDSIPLLAHHTISYSPSISWLEAVHTAPAQRRRPESVLAIASGDALPDSEAEIRAIAELYPHGDILLGEQATESAAKKSMKRHDVLHFATHGALDSESPMYSALLLARGSPIDDGRLEAREVAALSLDARVAVIASCDLGNGSIYPGEGIVGMSWAFLVAGCPSTVVSQWTVDSRATARLMTVFHRHLVKGESVARSLRRAALELRHDSDYAHPFYWAGFEAVGTADTP